MDDRGGESTKPVRLWSLSSPSACLLLPLAERRGTCSIRRDRPIYSCAASLAAALCPGRKMPSEIAKWKLGEGGREVKEEGVQGKETVGAKGALPPRPLWFLPLQTTQ